MKKKVFSLMMTLVLAFMGMLQAQTQTTLSFGFEDGSLPSGWTKEGPGSWVVTSGDHSTSTGTHTGTYNALCDHSTSGVITYLVTDAMDFSGVTEGTINCWFINRSWAGDTDEFGVYYRVNNGSWNELYNTSSAHSSWSEMGEIALTGFAANYQIGFKMKDNYGYGVGLDDITITTTAGGDEPGGDDPVVNPDGALFYESFDNCTGSGGNDDKWGSTVANGAFRADNDDWEAVASYGGKKCARFGSSRKSGEAKTPVINLPSEAVLTFKAAAWGTDGKTLKLSAEGATVVFSPAQVTMESSEWTTFTVKTTGKGSARIVFTPSKRFFLDEVTITDPNATTAVRTIATPRTTSGRIYTLDGRYVGTNPNQLPHGLYVIDGKKVIR